MEVTDINKNKKVYITAVAVITSTLLTISSAFAGDYYPEGPQLNVSVETVQSGGWELCFSDEFDDFGTPVQNMLNQCTGEYILLAGKYNNQADIAVLAAGEASAVFQIQTVYNQKTLNNGTYFYFFPDKVREIDSFRESHSIGFSLSEDTLINSCDIRSAEADYRLCRHIDGDAGQGYFDRGHRIGTNRSNNNLQATFQVYQSTGKASSNTLLLAQAEKQKQDTFILAATTLAIASVSNSLSQLTASLLPKTVCVKKGKKNKYVSALQVCPKGFKAK